jgi:hypothetical protein
MLYVLLCALLGDWATVIDVIPKLRLSLRAERTTHEPPGRMECFVALLVANYECRESFC